MDLESEKKKKKREGVNEDGEKWTVRQSVYVCMLSEGWGLMAVENATAADFAPLSPSLCPSLPSLF